MIEILKGYEAVLFGWAKRALQHEMNIQDSLNRKMESSYLTGTEIALLEDSGLFVMGIGLLVILEVFLMLTMLYVIFCLTAKLIAGLILKISFYLTKRKRQRQREAERLIQKRREAILLQYVLESAERTKGKPDVLKLPEFMVNRERRNRHAY